MSVRVLFHAVGADASDGDAAAFNLGACLPFNLGKRILGKFEPVNITDRAADTAEWGTYQNTAYTARLINRVVSLL